MAKKNIIVISLDEVRPDHLSCNGYEKINTHHIDLVAKEGVRFETCISTADFTPVAMGTVITGKYPNKHGMRDPYSHITGPSIGGILKKIGYITCGFVGNGLLAKQHGFAEGFDFWNETSKETSWLEVRYAGSDQIFYEGNYWVEEFFQWLKNNHKDRFFVWGHLYETHEGSEHTLLKKGLIKQGELTEFDYYDAKIKMADEKLIGRLLKTLDELNVSDDTILVVMSDHGTNLAEHPAKPIPWRKEGKTYPQHTTMYDHDLKVAMIIKGGGLPKGKKVKGMIGSVDLVPTLLDLVGVSSEKFDFDGSSLLPAIEKGEATGREVYSEDLFESRGEGALQSIRTEDSKLIRNLTLGTEEFYDLKKDPQEKNNIINEIDKGKTIELRKKLNAFLKGSVSQGRQFSKEVREKIDKRLRALGYIR
ncbi:MAG: sulfatase-like hydrolase/transferase [Candidatus Aenigmarchaeota archaeon]|nr:sulfatase-like hydrolase/transferase [Candidatus Aenigmarchaeota archaeon]